MSRLFVQRVKCKWTPVTLELEGRPAQSFGLCLLPQITPGGRVLRVLPRDLRGAIEAHSITKPAAQ